MTDTAIDTAVQPAPVKISRLFHAAPEIVFKAWSSAEHVKRWFHPSGYSAPDGRVEMRVGGPFEIAMQAPDGTVHWTRGTFVEVTPPKRLVLDLAAVDGEGKRLFRAFTEVDFVQELGGTRLDVVQTYTFDNPAAAAPMVAGAPIGWRQTLDKLEAEVARLRDGGDGAAVRSVVHATFHLERTYDAPVGRVFEALSTEAGKTKWFSGPNEQWERVERHFDFRVGGTERLTGRWASGLVTTFDATYFDIVPDARIVYAYEMTLDGRKISVSLATMDLEAAGPGRTRLKITEQGAFLDGYDDAGSREHGTGILLDRLGASLG